MDVRCDTNDSLQVAQGRESDARVQNGGIVGKISDDLKEARKKLDKTQTITGEHLVVSNQQWMGLTLAVGALEQRCRQGEDLLRRILDSGDFYLSALEFNHNVDGEEVEREIKEYLDGLA